ncbi:MAG: hypothetical protein ACREMF_04725 [Gemmatimonadales bacterium]
MNERLYARLRENVNIRLRRGAWYRVLKVADLKVILDVNGRPMSVAAALLEIVKRPPPRWTVVTQRASAARHAPPSIAERYGVCPSCGERAPLPRRADRMRCSYCKWEFEIAWDEAYLA